MALAAYTFVTEYEVKDYLKITRTTNTYDDILVGDAGANTGLINLACARIEEYCHNKFTIQDTGTVTWKGNGRSWMYLPYWPYSSLFGGSDAAKLANLQYRDTYNGTWTDLLTALDLIFAPSSEPWKLELLNGNVFNDADFPNLRIRYYAGWTTVPSELKQVAIEMVSQIWDESKQGGARLGISTKTLNTSSQNETTTFMDVNAKHRKILDKYRQLI